MTDVRQIRSGPHFPEHDERLENIIARRAPAIAPFALEI
jgi:hypothetical protein